MQWLAALCVRRPIFATVLILSLTVVGAFSFLQLGVDRFPKVDIPTIVAACTEQWFNQTLTKVNDSVVRIGIVEGEFHWHKHENDDEFFFVLDGQLFVELEERSIALAPWQGLVVSKGLLHRTRAPTRTVILMIETATILPTGD